MTKYLSAIFIAAAAISFFTTCGESKVETGISNLRIENPKLIDSYQLRFPEPSGLSFTFTKDGFWSVSDQNQTVYKLNFKGEILDSLVLKDKDLEGITAVDENTLAVVFEIERKVALIDLAGNELREVKLETNDIFNSGLEGITYVPSDSVFFVLNEKEPGLLIKLDKELNLLETKELNFAMDYSAVFYSEIDSSLWILSDESLKVFKCDMEGNVKSAYRVEVPQPEGFVMDADKNIFYVVSDSAEKIYIYEYK